MSIISDVDFVRRRVLCSPFANTSNFEASKTSKLVNRLKYCTFFSFLSYFCRHLIRRPILIWFYGLFGSVGIKSRIEMRHCGTQWRRFVRRCTKISRVIHDANYTLALLLKISNRFAMEFSSSKQKYHYANYTLYYLEHTQRKRLCLDKIARIFSLRYFSVSALTHVWTAREPAVSLWPRNIYYILTLRHIEWLNQIFSPRKTEFVGCNKTRLCVC